jgi:hypothetical protein
MWIPPEIKDPVVLHHPTRRSVGYFGAVRLRDGRFFYRRETGRFNAVSFWAFLKDLRRLSRRGGRRVIVITDNARYHHALQSAVAVDKGSADSGRGGAHGARVRLAASTAVASH